MVYINEAHAADTWNIGLSAGAINLNHKKISQRIECAKKLIDEFGLNLPVYCDTMDDGFENLFASRPTRYFVIENNKILMISRPVDSGYLKKI